MRVGEQRFNESARIQTVGSSQQRISHPVADWMLITDSGLAFWRDCAFTLQAVCSEQASGIRNPWDPPAFGRW